MNTKKGLIALTAIIVLFFFAAMPASASFFDQFEILKWEQVNDEGFGDPTSDYAWSMHEYKGYLYVGALNGNESDPPSEENDGLEIYRSPTGNYNSWEQVVGPNGTQFMIHPITGNIVPAKAGFRSFNVGPNIMEEYSGLLWVGTTTLNGCQVWVTNGTLWKRANIPGFGTSTNYGGRELTVFKGKIYAGVWDLRNTTDAYAEIWRYNGSTDFDLIDPNAWEQVVDKGFGEPELNKGIGGMAVFNPPDDGKDVEYLYAGTLTLSSPSPPILLPKGCEVWRSSTGDPGSWEEVVGNASGCSIGRGFGTVNNTALLSSKVFKGHLYMGTQNWFDAAEIWRTSDGTNWTAVTEDGFSGIKPIQIQGEKLNASNIYMWRMHEYNGNLFVGTLMVGLGCEIWMSPSGDPGTFKQVNLWGMDVDPLQYGARSFETFKDKLYVGTATYEAGCEVWRTSGETLLPPRIDVNKTVWDPEAGAWVDKLEKAHIGDTVRFRCEVHNNETSMLISIRVWDLASRSLEYAGDATVRYPSGLTLSREPDFAGPLTIMNHTIGTRLTWKFNPLLVRLDPSESITIEYNATVVKSLFDKDINIMSASGYYRETGRLGVGYDYVIVVDPPPDPGPDPGPDPDPVPVQVPALTPIGIMVLVGLLAVVAVGVIRKRQK